ncbi:MAG TPA: molybdopterin cofactor-binding domain-containing protein [Stellaceae bacterium]|nr:molybdopterin cofactor-binding domain-containing protein [Stellaceae bacterium]
MSAAGPSRRAVLAGGGALVVAFSLGPRAVAQHEAAPAAALPGDLAKDPLLDAWLRIGGGGDITVFTGKAELGQGLKTALVQLAAEELVVAPEMVRLVTADTALTPDEGYTAGSRSIEDSGTAIRNAAAQARVLLIERAATLLQLPAAELQASNGAVVAGDGRRLGFGELVGNDLLHVEAAPRSEFIPAQRRRLVGRDVPRVDLPAKVAGGVAFVQDLRLPKMVHGRVVLPPSYDARLKSVDTGGVARLPGVLKIVQDGSWLAVIAESEPQAIGAMAALAAAAIWNERPDLPDPTKLFATLAALPAETIAVHDGPSAMPAGAKVLAASYRRAYQMHGAIGPSCAVGLFDGDALTVWTHSQGVYPLRAALAELTGLPPGKVRCIHREGAGCYGHNGADDAAADAALLAMALPGRPVRVQWTRGAEHAWEPYGSAMLVHVRGAVDAMQHIVAWDYTVRSSTHSTRPGGAGNLIAARHRATPIAPPRPHPLPLPAGGGDRNAVPLYAIPRLRVMYDFLPAMPLRVSALRGLGAYMNIFAIESFVDELATAAGAGAIDFRLAHLADPRAAAVINTAAARFGWEGFFRREDHGRGFAFARYKNVAAFLALAVEVAVDRESGRVRLVRATAAVDSGEAVNPDGIRNQIEGGILQAASWTLYERVRFDQSRILSRDWSSYPIMRFSQVPDAVEVHVLDQPGQPFLGTGEAAQGPTAAAIANAIADAVGLRMRDIPITPEQVKAAIGI